MSVLVFPSNPVNGEFYPPNPLPGVQQYVYNSATNTWEIVTNLDIVTQIVAGDNIALSPSIGRGVVTISASFEESEGVFSTDVDGNIWNTSDPTNLTGSFGNFLVMSGVSLGAGSDHNVFIGTGSGGNIDASTDNVFIGAYSGSNKEGSQNVLLGSNAGSDGASGDNNVLIGSFSGQFSTGDHNTYIGFRSGSSNALGEFNVFTGRESGSSSSSSNSVYIGNEAGKNTSGSENIAVGPGAGSFNEGDNFVALGLNAGKYGAAGTQHNVYIGTMSGTSGTSGSENVFMGLYTGRFNTEGSNNVFLGSGAGRLNTEGSNNVFLGSGAGEQFTLSSNNVVVGGFNGTGFLTEEDSIFLSNGTGSLRVFINSTGAWGIEGANFGEVGQLLTSAGAGAPPIWSDPASTAGERRSDWDEPYNYLGTAPLGTLESDPIWNLTRLTIGPAGAVTVETAMDSWTNRTTTTYT